VKVIIDTNVMISAVLRGRVPEQVMNFVIMHDDWTWTASQEIVEEYVNVINRPKFMLPVDKITAWTDLIAQTVEIVEVDTEIDFPRDQKDAKFLSCAISSQADYLITGDRDFEDAMRLGITTILSVRQFKESVIDSWEKPGDNQSH
jgi:putative PIN family toxin of toxin-antitoxin system